MPRSIPVATLALTLVSALPVATAAAAPLNQPSRLPVGQVACITLKDAINYAAYVTEAPKFASDLLDRAACFKAKEDMDAILLGEEKGYSRLKLLSGHVVWIPANHPAVK